MNTENLASLFGRPVVILPEDMADCPQLPIGFDIYDVRPGLTELLINANVAPDNDETVQ